MLRNFSTSSFKERKKRQKWKYVYVWLYEYDRWNKETNSDSQRESEKIEIFRDVRICFRRSETDPWSVTFHEKDVTAALIKKKMLTYLYYLNCWVFWKTRFDGLRISNSIFFFFKNDAVKLKTWVEIDGFGVGSPC